MSGEIQRQTQCLKGEITQVEVLSSSSDNVDRDRPSEGKGGDEGDKRRKLGFHLFLREKERKERRTNKKQTKNF
jgi:hypothetical protein